MATDFSYDGQQIVASGPFKPSGKDMPVDARTRVETYADIVNIPNPHIGLKITVKVDETNNNKMTDYIVKSLKANSMGFANSVIDEVVRYVDYLGVSSSGGGTGEGLTTEQAQQLTTAYEHSQSKHVSMDEVNQAIANAQLSGGEVDLSTYATKTYTDNAISTALDGHTFKFLTQAEYDVLPDEEKNNPTIEYHITDPSNSENIDTTNLASDLSLSGLTLQLKNSNGDLIGTPVVLSSMVNGGNNSNNNILPNVVLFGDSITDTNANGEWVKVINDYATFKSLNNYARGYATWCFRSDSEYNITDISNANVGNNVIWNQFNRLVNDVSKGNVLEPDCIIICGGTNDALQGLPQGTPSTVIGGASQGTDITQLTTISDSIRYTVERIIETYPNCQIILATPLQARSKQTNAKIYTVHDTIVTCANLLGLKVIDQTYNSGIYQFKEFITEGNLFLKDDVHLKPEGGVKVAKFLAREFYNKINERYTETPSKAVKSIAATFNQGSNTIYNTDNLNTLKQYLTVTATYDDNSTSTVTNYLLSGTLNVGTSNITVTYSGKTTTFTVNVTKNQQTTYTITKNLTKCSINNSLNSAVEHSIYSATLTANSGYELSDVTITMGGSDVTSTAYSNGSITIQSVTGNIVITATAVKSITEKTLSSISAIYTQGSNTVYPSDNLNNLKSNLVVNATYSDSSTEVVTNYTLSGKLTVGTSIITVTYLDKTTTFNVTVSDEPTSNYTEYKEFDSSTQTKNTSFVNIYNDATIDGLRKAYLTEIRGSDEAIGTENGDGTYSFKLTSTNLNMYTGNKYENKELVLSTDNEYNDIGITIPKGSTVRCDYDFTKATTIASRLNIYTKYNGTASSNGYKQFSTTSGRDGLTTTSTTSYQESIMLKVTTGENVTVSNLMIWAKPASPFPTSQGYVEGKKDTINITIPTKIENGDVFSYSSSLGKWIITKSNSTIVETSYTNEKAFEVRAYNNSMNVLVDGAFKPTKIKVKVPINS